MNDYNKVILERVDKSTNAIVGIGSGTAFLAALILYLSEVGTMYAIFNFLAGIMLAMLYVFAEKVPTIMKVMVMLIITGLISIISFIGGSFLSSFLTLLILVNIVAVLFLEEKLSRIVSTVSVFVMLGIGVYATIISDLTVIDSLVVWGLQIFSFILLLIVLHISAYSIKNYLIENLENLELAVQQANKRAYYDRLTGLPNVYKFKKDIEKNINKEKKDGFLLLFNLRSIGLINSTLGREAGDQALIEVASIFRQFADKHTYIAKVGGNEFAFWMKDLSEKEILERFEDIIHELKMQSTILMKKMDMYSVYTKYEYGIDLFEECFQRANITLTYVKANNIHEVKAYDDTLERAFRRKEMIKEHIEQAMIKGEITLYYQIKYNISEDRVGGVEALARWENEELGKVAPSEFIPIIESMSLSVIFGNYVIRRACMDYEKVQEMYGKRVCISVNISPTHLADESIVSVIKEAIEEYNIPDDCFTIEITENILIEGVRGINKILEQIKELRVRVSLDDFGSGYSSLNYLTQIEFDEIKIDKSFIDQIEDNKRVHVLLENIIHLAEQYNLLVIAEGVETKMQNDVIYRLGCNMIQGYYYGKPEALGRKSNFFQMQG